MKLKSEKNNFDVIVAGAGMAGLGTAIALASLNKKVIVISRKKMKGESSPAAGGILDPLLEMNPGSFFLPFCMKAFRSWPADIRSLEKKSDMKIGYEACGMLYAALSKEDENVLKRRYVWQKKLGLSIKWMDRAELLKKEPLLSKNVLSGLFYPEIGRVQPRKLLRVMTKAAARAGVKFLFAASSPKIETENGKVSGVRVRNKFYSASSVVNATGSWAGLKQGLGPEVPVKPAKGQILVLRKGKLKIKNILHTVDGGYIVPWDKDSLLIGSTVEFKGFKPEVTAKGRRIVREKNQRLVPALKKCAEIDSWAGLRPFPADRYPLIGASRIPGLYLAAGYYRSGILIGLYSGKLLARGIVSGKMPTELKPLDPERFNGK